MHLIPRIYSYKRFCNSTFLGFFDFFQKWAIMHDAFLIRYGIIQKDSPIWPSLAPGFIGLSS